GTNFTGATAVTIGGTSATAITVVSATSITATTPAHAAATVDIVVTTPGGSGTGTGLYTYAAAPTVASIAPNAGPTAGGTSVTITGTNFTGATAVTIGGTSATAITVVSATSITATTPAHAAGTVDVVVTTPGGAATGTGLYTYAGGPAVTSVSPNSGTTLGGTSVTITGSNFTGATAVTFGGSAASTFAVVSATSITATTPAHGPGAVDIVVTTPGGAGTGTGLYSYAIPATTTTLSSSRNPSEAGQAVTFTATVSAPGALPTGTVTFNDGGVAIGSATLAGGTAALTTSALAIGNHTITAVFAGNASFGASSSAPLLQAVNTPQDSLKLRALQIIATKTVAQTSGSAITGAIDTAISEGFGNGGSLATPSAGGVRFNFNADPDQEPTGTAADTVNGRWNGAYGTTAYAPSGRGGSRSRVDDAFAAIDRSTFKTKAPQRYVEPKDWLLWGDIKGTGIGRWDSSNAPATLYGHQVNGLLGLTRRLMPNFLVGVVGGYEYFDYRSDTLNGRLKGDGWTIGSYLGWKFAAGLRFDAAVAYSGLNYDGTAGTATGRFDGDRWLLSGGLIGTTEAFGFAIEPSARVYALWENQHAYTDSLGTPQAERSFFTGRASTGFNVAYPWLFDATLTISPYAGIYADYYFTGDDAAAVTLAGAAPLTSVPFIDGWSARATGGLAARFDNGAAVAIGAELGGIGSNAKIWSFRGRGSVPF
ncbi:MAG: outer rane autotransporter barrel domain protein, partial [Tardiphaga sp.]|nr:outer rane autotransporter barrel domain protein [Tardiphaga sp.]